MRKKKAESAESPSVVMAAWRELVETQLQLTKIVRAQENRLAALEKREGIQEGSLDHHKTVLTSQGAALMAIDRAVAELLKMARKAGWEPVEEEPEEGPPESIN